MNNEEKAKIIADYFQKSQVGDTQYSPLQCAAYMGDRSGVQVLLNEYTRTSTLQKELNYAGGKFGENILHIAIKDPVIFMQCCDALKSVGLFEHTLLRPDSDGDSVMHQVVEFGRKEALEALILDDEMRSFLSSMIRTVKNKQGETPLDIANNFKDSRSITALKMTGVLTDKHLVVTKQNLSRINEIFLTLEDQPRSVPRM